jgi:glycerol uptake facilitator-like aquaporin
MTAGAGRRLLAEFTGTGLLVAVVVGSGIASAPAFIAAQLAGGAVGALLAVTLYPARPTPVRAEEPAHLAS